MINRLLFFFSIIIFCNLISINAFAGEVFNFDVTEVEIVDEGNIFIGKKGGTATTEDGTIIKAKNFEYDKITNILIATGDVEIDDKKENVIIYSQKITYLKNKEFVLTDGKSKAITEDIIIDADNFIYNKNKNILNANGAVKIDNKDENYLIYADDATYLKNEDLFLTEGKSKAINEGFIIDADNFRYNKIKNILNANGNVKMEDTINDYLVFANEATYYKNSEKVITKGNTEAFIQSRYDVNSKDVTYFHNEQILTSENKTKIIDQSTAQVYFAEKFNYYMDKEIIKGEEILIITNYNLPKSDKFFLENSIINLKDSNFIAKDTEIKIHKKLFDVKENDPRIVGASSNGDKDYTIINKGVFTCCEKNDSSSAWSIKATKIKHDKANQELIYDNPIIRLFDVPVFYMPKFWHPDPSVERKSGFLKPETNDSTILGTSFTMPYFKVISENKDLTYTPVWFDTDTFFSSVEYRQENKNSTLLADFAAVNNYESYTTKKRNTQSHIFLNYQSNLNLNNYLSSDLNISIQRASQSHYLSVFAPYRTKVGELIPLASDLLLNKIALDLDHENYNFETGMVVYDSLSVEKKSDRYTYNTPYYGFSKNISQDFLSGNFSFGSSGNNVLTDTNALETTVTNTLTYNSMDYISNLGFKTNFGANYRHLNSIGKKSIQYKSSLKSEIISLYNLDISLPLIKENEKYINFFTPKLSFRVNPSDMKDHSATPISVGTGNIFALNRLALSSYESGRSLTLGLDYNTEWLNTASKKEVDIDSEPSYKKVSVNKIDQINNYFNASLATVLRDKEENFIPNTSTLNRKNSNLFGSFSSKISDNIKINYDFSLDNDFNTLETNAISTILSSNNIVTKFDFIEENGESGDASLFKTQIDYNFNDENILTFETRRNRKIAFTEYYDLVYQYRNDCLTAGIKYHKKYYKNGDLRPSQNLLFTVTLFPITSYEHDADDLLKDQDSFLNNLEFSEEMFM